MGSKLDSAVESLENSLEGSAPKASTPAHQLRGSQGAAAAAPVTAAQSSPAVAPVGLAEERPQSSDEAWSYDSVLGLLLVAAVPAASVIGLLRVLPRRSQDELSSYQPMDDDEVPNYQPPVA